MRQQTNGQTIEADVHKVYMLLAYGENSVTIDGHYHENDRLILQPLVFL
jgi:hypothetical protein